MGDFAAGYSRSAIDRAGVVVRDAILGRDHDPEDLDDALEVMIAFRETFQVPLDKTVMGLRSMVCSESPELSRTGDRIPVAQRLKRGGLYLESQGVAPDPVFQREFETIRSKVRPYFQR